MFRACKAERRGVWVVLALFVLVHLHASVHGALVDHWLGDRGLRHTPAHEDSCACSPSPAVPVPPDDSRPRWERGAGCHHHGHVCSLELLRGASPTPVDGHPLRWSRPVTCRVRRHPPHRAVDFTGIPVHLLAPKHSPPPVRTIA